MTDVYFLHDTFFLQRKQQNPKSPNQSCYPKETYCLLKSHLLCCYNHVWNFENRNKCLSKYSTCLLLAGDGNGRTSRPAASVYWPSKIWLVKDRICKLKHKNTLQSLVCPSQTLLAQWHVLKSVLQKLQHTSLLILSHSSSKHHLNPPQKAPLVLSSNSSYE